jgi:hypothetical protein
MLNSNKYLVIIPLILVLHLTAEMYIFMLKELKKLQFISLTVNFF